MSATTTTAAVTREKLQLVPVCSMQRLTGLLQEQFLNISHHFIIQCMHKISIPPSRFFPWSNSNFKLSNFGQIINSHKDLQLQSSPG